MSALAGDPVSIPLDVAPRCMLWLRSYMAHTITVGAGGFNNGSGGGGAEVVPAVTVAVTAPPGGLTPVEIAVEMNARAARSAIYGDTKREVCEEGRATPWRVSPEPHQMPAELVARMTALGPSLLAFLHASNKLYADSIKGIQPPWVAELLDRGKPEALVEFQRMNRFRNLTPRVIRPDLVVGDDGRLAACELDAVPGGIGFTGFTVRRCI